MLARRLAFALVACASFAASTGAGEIDLVFRPPAGPHGPAGPPLPAYPVQLVLDDGLFDGAIGVSSPARQFLWFQRFAGPAAAFRLEEVWVLFDDDGVIAPGSAIQIVAFHDSDGDPTNGATFLVAYDTTVQTVSGDEFSVYPLPIPPIVPGGGDVLVGVVNRYVTSGVTPSTQPATFDATSPDGRAWLATWTGDPPDPPTLPSDGTMELFSGAATGDWMIRGFGTPLPPPAPIPALNPAGLAALAVLLALLAAWRLRA